MIDHLADVEAKAADGISLSRQEADRVARTLDLIRVGVLGETARRRRAGMDVTFGRVAVATADEREPALGEAGEVRLTGRMRSIDEACQIVGRLRALAPDALVSGLSAADLRELAGHGAGDVGRAASALKAAGLDAIAEVPLDRLNPTDTVHTVLAARDAGLLVMRLTVDVAPADLRTDLIFAAHDLQRTVGGIQAFAPLPRIDPVDTPATGYDDVRTVALAALVCSEIPFIQVDWPLYGPKLAQMAIAYGANDVDGIDAQAGTAGPRRSARDEIERQIRAAGGVPVERNGRFERRP